MEGGGGVSTINIQGECGTTTPQALEIEHDSSSMLFATCSFLKFGTTTTLKIMFSKL